MVCIFILGHTQSPRPRKRRHHVTHLSVLSDISSDELSSDEKRETDDDDDDDDQTRKVISTSFFVCCIYITGCVGVPNIQGV